MAAGEGIETMLLLRCNIPSMAWWQHYRQRISELSFSQQRCAVSISSVTTIGPAMVR